MLSTIEAFCFFCIILLMASVALEAVGEPK